MPATPRFRRYIGIDYSGAETPTSSLKGLRVYAATSTTPPSEVPPPPDTKWYWTREGIANWLVERLREEEPTVVGIDHAFSFPLPYFKRHRLPMNWPAFLDDFVAHWPTGDNIYVDFVRDGSVGNGAARKGSSKWRRLTEVRARGAKSVFHFDVPGSVAKATHAGLPWLRHIRQQLGSRVHFWPFDGWDVPPGRSTVLEVYPSIWNWAFKREDRTPDQHDAWSIAEQLKRLDGDGYLGHMFTPEPSSEVESIGRIEGWILVVHAG